MIDWSKQDDTKLEIAGKIADRLERELCVSCYRMVTIMDLMACNMTCPLDFDKLLTADKFTLIHDLGGINRHLCHETGQLKNHFVPRCALREDI